MMLFFDREETREALFDWCKKRNINIDMSSIKFEREDGSEISASDLAADLMPQNKAKKETGSK